MSKIFECVYFAEKTTIAMALEFWDLHIWFWLFFILKWLFNEILLLYVYSMVLYACENDSKTTAEAIDTTE